MNEISGNGSFRNKTLIGTTFKVQGYFWGSSLELSISLEKKKSIMLGSLVSA